MTKEEGMTVLVVKNLHAQTLTLEHFYGVKLRTFPLPPKENASTQQYTSVLITMDPEEYLFSIGSVVDC